MIIFGTAHKTAFRRFKGSLMEKIILAGQIRYRGSKLRNVQEWQNVKEKNDTSIDLNPQS